MSPLTPIRRSPCPPSPARLLALIFCIVTASVAAAPLTECRFESIPRSRIVVLTDLGNEADDSQTMVRLLAHITD